MKKLLLSMLLALSFNLFAVEFDTVEDAVYYEFLCEKIPQRLVEPFYENTKYNKPPQVTNLCDLRRLHIKKFSTYGLNFLT